MDECDVGGLTPRRRPPNFEQRHHPIPRSSAIDKEVANMTNINTPIDARTSCVGQAFVALAMRHHPGEGVTRPT
jgi:hypothetical protein